MPLTYKKEKGSLATLETTSGIMNTYTKLTALATTILLTSALAAPANAETSVEATQPEIVTASLPVTADPEATITFDKPTVETVAAPPVVAQPEPAPVEVKANTKSLPTTTSVAAQVAPAIQSAPASGKGAAIAAAAYAQLGVAQDCTRLATNALATVGIHHHGWPASYMSLGTIVSDPQPGDLIYYSNAGAGVPHIAVYVGGGKAVHGGWNGGTTSLQSAYLGSGPVFIRVA
jgi:cell wall-associated NlpC family hydrolase